MERRLLKTAEFPAGYNVITASGSPRTAIAAPRFGESNMG
jgi:hypothetical protein